MKEIKVRAWINKKMMYGPTDDIVSPSLVLELCKAWGAEPMLFTGRQDKNGKDIYEGDIVKNDWYDVYGNYIGDIWIVKFGEYDDSDIEYGSPGLGFYCENKHGEQQSIINLPTDNNDKIEVIANVFENPEFIKRK